MSFRRYEIILPTRYNDGALIEPLKYWDTAEKLWPCLRLRETKSISRETIS
jgi:hypothetical protein